MCVSVHALALRNEDKDIETERSKCYNEDQRVVYKDYYYADLLCSELIIKTFAALDLCGAGS